MSQSHTTIQVSGEITYIESANMIDGFITSAKIADATIQHAKIANGTITNAKISGALQSDTWNGVVGWYLGKDGGFQMGNADGSGRVYLNGNGLTVTDAAGTVRVQVGRVS